VSFFSTRGTCGRQSAYDSFALLKKRLGIDPRITPHDFRRTTAIAVLETTGDIREVQAVLGHKRLATTVQYLGGALSSVTENVLERAKLNPPKEKK
jgi:integrase